LPLAVGGAATAALAIGALSLRTRGIYFIMVTLAFGEMLFYLFHDNNFAGGSDGTFINIKPEAMLFGVNVIDLDKARVFYWVVLALVVLTILILYLLTRSPFGRALTASRDNERRARSLGFPVYRVRLTAFVISGALAGVAGYFAAAQFGFVAPQMLGWHQSAIALVMVVLGGMHGVAGPLIGAVVVMGLEEYLKGLTEHWKLAEGLIIIAVVLAVPGGVQSLITRIAPERHDG
jgi:branched-chain amino acid transport system permease protein